jgi:hypothetical protein
MAFDQMSDVESWISGRSLLNAAHTYILVYEPLTSSCCFKLVASDGPRTPIHVKQWLMAGLWGTTTG